MFKRLKKDVRIAKSPEVAPGGLRPWADHANENWRDTRPGHYAITGTFIKLPDRPETRPERPE